MPCDDLARAEQRYRQEDPATIVDGSLRTRHGVGDRAELDQVLPGAFEQAVADAAATFELELPALRDWSFGEADARHITARHPISVRT